MKRHLLIFALRPGSLSTGKQITTGVQAQVLHKEKPGAKFNSQKLLAMILLALFISLWSTVAMSQQATYYSGSGSYTVPPGVTQVRIYAVGGAGGAGGQDCGNGCGYNYGVWGQYTSGTFNVSPGSTLSYYVGANGGNGSSNITGTCNGGGSGGWGYYYGGNGGGVGGSGASGGGGGGGGASAVTSGGSLLLVAGGGGGGGGRCNTAGSGTAGSTSTGGGGSGSGSAGSCPGSGADGGGGGGGGGGYVGGGGGGLYGLNGEYAAYGGYSGSSSPGGSYSGTSPYVQISYTAVGGTASASPSSICSGSSSTISLSGYAGYISWYYSTDGSNYYYYGSSATSFNTGNLTSTRYYKALISGTTWSSVATVSIYALTSAPSSASSTGTTQNTASLSWGAGSGNGTITYYWVVGASSGIGYPDGSVAGRYGSTTGTTASATGLSPNTAYYLRVYASATCGNSGYQTSAAFTTVPVAPVANTETNVRANSFTANWTASTSGASGYYIDISRDNFSTYLSGYQNKYVGNVTSFSLSGLNRNTTYYYRVRAYNSGGQSVNSNPISFTTLDLNNFLVEKVGTGSITNQMAGVAFSTRITARDSYNTTVTDFTGTTTITTNSTLTTGGTTAAFSAGILASHSVTLTLTGVSKTLTATYSGSPVTTSTSNTFTVLPNILHHFALAVDGTITAGIPFTVTATAYDVYNNIKTNYGGLSTDLNYTGTNSVNWTTTAVSSPKGIARIIAANGNQTFTNGVSAGITGFTLFNSDQTQLTPFTSPTITISDAPTAKQGTTAPIVVKNNVLDNLKVVSGTKQTANIPFGVTVTARDIYWNTCVDYTGSIRFKTSDDLLVTFPPGLQPFTVSDQGVRTFSTINIQKVGAYWLRAADSQFAYKSGQQENIVVEPGAFLKSASISVVSIDSPNKIAGQNVVVTLTPRDSQGNLLYSCQTIKVLLDGVDKGVEQSNGTTLGSDGVYVFNVQVTSTTAPNVISATFQDPLTSVITPFDQTYTITVTPAPPSLAHTLITPDAGSITTDGSQLVSVQLKDQYNNNRTTDDGLVSLATNLGGFGGNNASQTVTATYNGTTSGRYSATLYASYSASNHGVGIAAITGSVAFNASPGPGVWSGASWPSNGDITDAASVAITEGLPYLSTIDISANPGEITSNETSLISVQLKDQLGNLITHDRGIIALSSPLGTLSAVAYTAGGIYQSTLSGFKPGFGPTTITGTYNSEAITDNTVVTINEGLPDLAHITILASKSPMTTDESSTITVQLKDVFDNNLTTSRGTITLISSIGSLSSVTDNTNGTYTATLIGDSRGFGNAIISGKLDNAAITNTATVSITQGLPTLAISTISASKSPMTTDETSIITVQLKDQWGNNLTTSRGTVTLSTTLGALTGVTDNSNGTYTATLSGNNTGAGTATITGSLSGTVTGAFIDDASVIITEGLPVLSKIQITANPASITSDETSTITIQLKDQWENNLTTSRGIITLATAPIGHLTSVTDNSNGSYTATFSLTAFGTGTATITGNFAGSGSASGVSGAVTDNATIEVAHGIAAKLTVLTQPSATATAGVVFAQQPAVRIEDQFGNLVNTDNTTVLTAARSTGSDVLKGTLTATAANGIATFTNLFYTKAESITLGYTSNPALTTTSSSSILVGHAPAAYFALNAPADFIAGATRAAYTVTRYDEFANLVTTNAQTVYLTNNSTGLNKKYYNAASAGSVITQLTIANGASSANFWYYDEKTGNIDVVASENTPADGNTGIDDAVDQIIVKPTVLKDFVVQDVPDPHDLGTWQSVKVIARDSYDNIKTNYVGKVTFSNTDLTATNPADYQFQLSDMGVHVFVEAVKFSQTGNWWLTALDWNDPSKYGAQPDITVQRAVRLTANARTKTYGDALTLGITEFSLAAIVTGFDPIDGDITGVTLTSSGAVGTANAGDYNITPSNATGPHADLYRVVYVDGTLTVNKKPLTITSPTITSREYNATQTAGSVTVGTLSGFVGSQTVTATATAADYTFADAASYPGTVVTYTLHDGSGLASNYSLANGTATGDINPRALTATSTVADKTYDGSAVTGVVSLGTVSTLVSGEDLAITPSASDFADANAADGKATTISYALANGTNGLAANYSMADLTTATGDINPANLTVTATGPVKAYGTALTTGITAINFIAAGIVNSEVVTSVTLTPDAAGLSATSSVGAAYVVTPSLATGTDGFLAGNYNITYTAFNGTVGKKILTVTADAKSKTYDGSGFSSFTSTITGFVNGETISNAGITGSVMYSGAATIASDAGSYAITPVVTGLSAANYSFTSANGSLYISSKTINVTAVNKQKEIEESDPVLTYTYTPALTGGDSFSGTLTREGGNTVGNYRILKGSLSLNSNYDINFQEGNFSIVDNTPPSWENASTELDRKIEYSNATELTAAQALAPTAFDNNGVYLTKTSGQFEKSPGCDHTGTYTNKWTAKDNSGNTSIVYTQVITIIDTTKPVFAKVSTIQLNITSGLCETSITYPEIIATDLCLDKIELKSGLGKDGLFPIGTTIETWKATDKSGNTEEISFQVVVKTSNIQPLVAQVKDFSVYRNSKQVEVSLTGIDPTSDCNNPQEIVALNAVAVNGTLITDVSVNYTKGSTSGKLFLKIADNAEGESLIRVTLKDNGGTENGGSDTKEMTFKIKVAGLDKGPALKSEIPTLVNNPGGNLQFNPNSYFTSQNGNPLTYTLALADGTPLPSWMVVNPQTGAISGIVPSNNNGSYQIVITTTDSDGLSTKNSFWLVITTNGTTTISGTVSSANGAVTDGVQVVLLSVDAQNKTLVVDKKELNETSFFMFTGLPSGSYLLKANITDVAKYPALLNTYYNGSSSVITAKQIDSGSITSNNIKLVMLNKTSGTGNGSISGHVVSKEGPVSGTNPLGLAAANVDVVLKQDGKIVANTTTDIEGKYSFNALPEGIFNVEVEQLGYVLNVIEKATITANSMNLTNVNFTIWTSGTITEVKDLREVAVVNMYPNPTNGQLNIVSSKDRPAIVSVFNAVGKEILRKNYLSGAAINIDLSGNVSGIYLVKLESEGESVIRRIILRK